MINTFGAHTVIIADGTFPTNKIPLGFIRTAERIVCCDGSADNTLLAGFTPDAIVGDMDSLSKELANRFADRLFPDDDQSTNENLVIVGATGKREDHTIGNISLLAEYINDAEVIMITDTGIFKPLIQSSAISSFAGQQVSIFSIDPETEITSAGLKYPLENTKIKNWWFATLNEALGENFSLEFNNGRVII